MVIDVAIFIVVLMLLVLMILLPSSDDSSQSSLPRSVDSVDPSVECRSIRGPRRNRPLISTFLFDVSTPSTRSIRRPASVDCSETSVGYRSISHPHRFAKGRTVCSFQVRSWRAPLIPPALSNRALLYHSRPRNGRRTNVSLHLPFPERV